MAQNPASSERDRALFALGAMAVGLARDGAILPGDLTAIVEALRALIEAKREEARDAA